MTDNEEAIAELNRQIRAYEATVHNLHLQLEAVGAGGVQSLANGDKLQVIARQVLRDMQAQDVLHEWHDLLAEALAAPQQEVQEPFCFASVNKQGDVKRIIKRRDKWSSVPLYTTPKPAHSIGAEGAAADADLWYLQDTRSYIGNDVLWWAKDGNGYTTDVSKAHVYGKAEAFRQAAMRGTDRAWPKAYIDSKTRPAVDIQYIDHKAAMAAQKGGAA